MPTLPFKPLATRRFPSALTPLLAALLLATACAHARDGHAPLPHGWHEGPLSRGQPYPESQVSPLDPSQRTPLWGVPRFEPPRATHCARPPNVREVPGGQPFSGRGRGESAAMSARDLAKATTPALTEGAAVAAEASRASPAPSSPPPMASPKVAEAPGRRADAVAEARSETADALGRAPRNEQRRDEPVAAGMVDDNGDFGAYEAFRARHPHRLLRNRDLSERYRVEVRDAGGRPVPDAELALSWPGAAAGVAWARSDAGGAAWLHPRALVAPAAMAGADRMTVMARSAGGEIVRATLTRGQKAAVSLRFHEGAARPALARVPLDLVFVVDATGSMGDEIDKLKRSMKAMADRIASLPAATDLCFGLVAYRDRGDAFLTRTHDLTNDLGAFQRVLSSLHADAGGDEPEALNEALERTMHDLAWRGAGTTRLVVLLGDAPPQMRPDVAYYDESAAVALAKGIKIHAVGASGLNRRGEATFRSLAQSTGGRFVFLTYRDAARPDRGPGSETVHDVRNYSVETLDDLIVRLVGDEIGLRDGG